MATAIARRWLAPLLSLLLLVATPAAAQTRTRFEIFAGIPLSGRWWRNTPHPHF
jgi:hypothetical protein